MARGGRFTHSRGPGSRGASRGRGHAYGRARARGRGGNATQSRNGFATSRLRDAELNDDDQEPSDSEVSSEMLEDEGEQDAQISSEDEEPEPQQSYASLLQALNARPDQDGPPRKKRRTEAEQVERKKQEQEVAADSSSEEREIDTADAALTEEIEDDFVDEEDEVDSDDESVVLHDPFEKHYARMEEQALKQAMIAVDEKQRRKQDKVIGDDMRKTAFFYKDEGPIKAIKKLQDLNLKKRLLEGGSEVFKTLSAAAKDVAGEVCSYRDVQYGSRNVENAPQLRDLTCLHALNHVFKTRDRVLKNNAKASQQTGDQQTDLRDQGFTRPKVLFIVPTKQACARYVESIAQISQADQQENKSRFLETFSSPDDSSWDTKPEDFQELFGGNHEEDFRVGLKFTRKTIKYFSGFYNSDIIFGSALGLMRTITTGGGPGNKDNKKKVHDADFLSSIEIVVVDHAAAIQMQNWQHLEYVFSQLNLLPRDSHGCDFGRIRHWCLDGHSKYLRQTIVLSAYHTPEINALFTTHTSNTSGLVKYTPVYQGAMLTLPPTLPTTPPQTFLRFDSPTPSADPTARFTYFTTAILPPLLLRRQTTKGVLLFIPTYADFTRLRNHFATSPATASLSFGSVSEYTPVRDVARARSHFTTGRHHVLLYSERAHHHFRYHIRGVTRIVFYGVPENPVFWRELVEMLVVGGGQHGGDGDDRKTERGGNATAGTKSKGAVRALFSRWDVLKLERIVGSERVGRLIGDKGGDVFEFV